MSIQFTILGLDRISASIGLALGRHSDQFERTGFDHMHATAMHAEKINAVDHVELNLLKSVKKADVILLALPLNLTKETLSSIAPVVQAGVVILDTSSAKQSVATWVRELIQVKCHYIGITPLVNGHYLNDLDGSILSAKPDLFENSLMAIAAPEETDAAALKLASDLSGLLGASPLFCDMAELDGFIVSTCLVPQLLSATLLTATLDQPGWTDAGKFAGAEYAAVSSGMAGSEDTASIREAVLLNKEIVLRNLDGLLTTLHAFRDVIQDDRAPQLGFRLDGARVGRQKWWQDRQKTRPIDQELQSAEMPKAGDFWKQQLGFLSGLSGRHSPKPDKKE